jgi:hypothetical protein
MRTPSVRSPGIPAVSRAFSFPVRLLKADPNEKLAVAPKDVLATAVELLDDVDAVDSVESISESF